MLKYLKPGFWLPNDKFLDAAKTHAQSIAVRWDVPQGEDVPEDLRDVKSRYALTAPDEFGRQYRVGGSMKPDDLHEGFYSEAIPLLFMMLPILGMLAAVFAKTVVGHGLIQLAILSAVLLVMNCISTATKSMWWGLSAGALGVVMPIAVSVNVSAHPDFGKWALGMVWDSVGPTSLIPAAIICGLVIYSGSVRKARLLIGAGVGLILDLWVSTLVWGWLSPLVLALPGLGLGWFWAKFEDFNRAFDLVEQGNKSSWENSKWVTAHIPGRKKQAIQARKDDAMASTVHLGTATGEFTGRSDPWAPDADLPFVMNVLNFATHLLITGFTGTGKTELLKKIVGGYVRSKIGGAFIMDGKSSLAIVFRRLLGYRIIEPGRTPVGLYQNLSASDVSRTLRELNITDDTQNKDKMWNEEAYTLCNYSALVTEALCHITASVPEEEKEWHWTPHDHHAFANMGLEGANARREKLPDGQEVEVENSVRNNVMAYLDAIYRWHPEGQVGLLKDARNYFLVTLPAIPDVTRGGIGTNFNSWITPLMSHRDLLSWSKSERGVEVEDCLHGALIGVNMPYARYARAGQIAQAFLKCRVFSAIRKRADAPEADWRKQDPTAKPVLIVMDEAHLLIGDADMEIAPIGRSLGAWLVVCSQGVESFKSVSKNIDKVMAFLDSFQSRITLASSPGTIKYFWERMGKVWRPIFSQAGSVAIDMVGSAADAADSMIYQEGHAMGHWMKTFRRLGAGQFMDAVSGKPRNRGSVRTALAIQPRTTSGKIWEEVDLINPTDFHTYTAAHGIALATVVRGNSPRRDFIQLDKMVGELPADICDPDFVDEAIFQEDEQVAMAVAATEDEALLEFEPEVEEALANAAVATEAVVEVKPAAEPQVEVAA